MNSAAVALRVLALNPAFLLEMKDANPEVWNSQHQLRQICDGWSPIETDQTLRQLVPLLSQFRDQLATQFSLEETFGFQEVPSKGDQFAHGRLIQQAQDEHCPLYLQIADLSEQAEELQYRGAGPKQLGELVDSFKSFDERLRAHENLEAELIECSLNSDS